MTPVKNKCKCTNLKVNHIKAVYFAGHNPTTQNIGYLCVLTQDPQGVRFCSSQAKRKADVKSYPAMRNDF